MTTAKVLRQIARYENLLGDLKRNHELNQVAPLDAAFETKIHIVESAIKNLRRKLPEGS